MGAGSITLAIDPSIDPSRGESGSTCHASQSIACAQRASAMFRSASEVALGPPEAMKSSAAGIASHAEKSRVPCQSDSSASPRPCW